jgi:transcriptional regulator with XRE-family HTH domain
MTGAEMSRAMTDAGLTLRQLSRLTGAQPRSLQRYLEAQAEQDAAPHWLRVLLVLLANPQNMRRALRVTEEELIDEQGP